MAESGWIKLHRNLLNWEWYEDLNTRVVFMHLLLTVNYEDKKKRGKIIPRGSRTAGIYQLAEECGLSVQKTRTAISKLLSTNEITSKSTSQFTVYTIVKYEHYQSYDDFTNKQSNNQSNKPVTNEQQTSNKRVTTPKEIKNIKNKKIKNIYMSDFLDFWDLYPKHRRNAKSKIYEKWKKFDDDLRLTIIASLKNHVDFWATQADPFIPNATTWVNEERWERQFNLPVVKSPGYSDKMQQTFTAASNFLRRQEQAGANTND